MNLPYSAAERKQKALPEEEGSAEAGPPQSANAGNQLSQKRLGDIGRFARTVVGALRFRLFEQFRLRLSGFGEFFEAEQRQILRDFGIQALKRQLF